MENPFQILLDRLDQLEQRVIDLQLSLDKKTVPSSDEFWTVEQVAEFLRLTVATVYTKVSRNTIPNMRRGGRLYFQKSAIESWLQGGRRKTNEELQNEVQEYLVSSRRRK